MLADELSIFSIEKAAVAASLMRGTRVKRHLTIRHRELTRYQFSPAKRCAHGSMQYRKHLSPPEELRSQGS